MDIKRLCLSPLCTKILSNFCGLSLFHDYFSSARALRSPNFLSLKRSSSNPLLYIAHEKYSFAVVVRKHLLTPRGGLRNDTDLDFPRFRARLFHPRGDEVKIPSLFKEEQQRWVNIINPRHLNMRSTNKRDGYELGACFKWHVKRRRRQSPNIWSRRPNDVSRWHPLTARSVIYSASPRLMWESSFATCLPGRRVPR